MCIIIAKQKGIEFDPDELEKAINNGLYRNNDGSGFALKKVNEERILISKGYFDEYLENDLLNERQESQLFGAIMRQNVGIEDELVVHLRYSTAGEDSISNCHPYVVSNNSKNIILDSHRVKRPVAAHNGTFWNYNPTRYEYQTKKERKKHGKLKSMSDTYYFVKHFLSREGMIDELILAREYTPKLYEDIMTFNKLAILFPDDRPMALLGDFITEGNLKYSNSYYKSVEEQEEVIRQQFRGQQQIPD